MFEQVVVIDHLLLQLGGLIGLVDVGDLLRHAIEKGEMVVSFVVDAAAGVARIADHIGDNLWFRVVLTFDELWVDCVDCVFEQALGLALIENGVVTLEADFIAVNAEYALRGAVEGAAPKLTPGNHGEVFDALEHLPRGLIGKGEQEDLVGLHVLVQEVGHAIGERAGLARSGTSQHEGGARLGGDGGVLLVVELGAEIDGGEGWIEAVVVQDGSS